MIPCSLVNDHGHWQLFGGSDLKSELLPPQKVPAWEVVLSGSTGTLGVGLAALNISDWTSKYRDLKA